MDFLMIFLAIGFLETIWMWSASRKKSPTVIYPVWYRPLRFLLMAIIFLPCLLIAFDLFPSEESLRMAVAVELAALVLLFMLGRVKGKRVETRPETEENARWKAQRSQAGSLWLITFAASLAAVYFIYFR
jgi:glucan phosphoethanolaminetransferase (alkaline phosphatase superfamily)